MKAMAFETIDALNQAAVRLLREAFEAPEAAPACVLLSGGKTPRPLFDALREDPPAVSARLHIAYTDDRYVPAEAPESNYGQTRPMLTALGIAPEHVLRVPTELPLAEAAAAYDAALRRLLSQGGTIPLALLGLGADGHTCSLFSAADFKRGQEAWAIAVDRPDGMHGITVTPALLRHVERIVFLVSGPEKAARIAQLREAPDTLIAGQAVAGCKHVELWYSGG